MTGKAALAPVAVTLAFAAALAAPAAAQEQEGAQEGGAMGVVVSQQVCTFAALDDLNGLVREYWAPILDRAVGEGVLTGWGVLNHLWGDEWNWVVYYSGPNPAGLSEVVGNLLGEIFEAMPGDPMEEFTEMCSAHKDNVYVLVASQGVEAPAAAGAGEGDGDGGPSR